MSFHVELEQVDMCYSVQGTVVIKALDINGPLGVNTVPEPTMRR